MRCIYIFLLIFAELSWSVTDAAYVYFHVNNLDEDYVTCNDNKTKSITVLEDETIPIDISLIIDRRIESIKCFKQHDLSEQYFNVSNAGIRTSDLSYQVFMPVKQDMGTVQCTIEITKEDSRERSIDYSPDNVYPAQCLIKVHVRIKKPYQTILINNMILQTTIYTEFEDNSFDHQAVYYYAIGDAVNVSCINLENNDSYNIYLQYDYAEKLDGSYKNILQVGNPLGYGFSTTLLAEHNKTVMICTCKGLYDTSSIKVTFIQKEFNDDGYIEVNGHIGRQVFEETHNILIKYDYVFKNYQDINLVCRSNKTGLIVGDKCTHPEYGNKQVFEKKVRVPSSLNCHLCHKRKLIKSFEINVTALPREMTEYYPPAMQQLPKTNIALQIHDYKYSNTWIHYVYEEGDNVTLKCCQTTRSLNCHTIYNTKFDDVSIGKTGKKINDEVTLTAAHDGHSFTCSSKLYGYLKKLTVKFSKKKLITNDTSIGHGIPASFSFSGWLIGVAGALICIILLSITIVIYKRYHQRAEISKRRNENEQILHSNDNVNFINNEHDDTYVNLLRTQNKASKNNEKAVNSILDDPHANLSKLQSKVGKNDYIQNDDKIIYSEPVNAKSDTYANLSKLQNRPNKNDEKNINCGPEDNDQFQVEAEEKPQIIYAELNIDPQNLSTANRTEALYVEARQMYAQVLPKSKRNNRNPYDNVIDNVRYVNSKDAEYVEPTYSEAFKK